MGKGLGEGHGRNGRAANVLYIILDNSILFKGFDVLLTIRDAGGKCGLAGKTPGAHLVTTRSANTNITMARGRAGMEDERKLTETLKNEFW